MPEFLELLPPSDALKRFFSALPVYRPQKELEKTIEALGRVTALPVVSPEALPAFSRSTVDGFAVYAADTFGSSDSLPAYLQLVGEVPMGKAPGFTLQPGQAAVIHTGGMLPAGADAVVMLEFTQMAGEHELEVLKAAAQNENVLLEGEDVSRGQIVMQEGVRLRPAEIGGLLALGIIEIAVAARPRVAILSSGDEVIPPQERTSPGQVRDINSYSLGALVQQAGGTPVFYGIVPDSAEALATTMAAALADNDAVVITAGSSASSRDLTAEVVNRMGRPGVIVHGVNVRPGKPTILGVCDGKPVIGLPGNPVSALVIAGLFLTPVIDYLNGLKVMRPKPVLQARLSINLPSQAGREDWIPARIHARDDGYDAEPIFFKSNLIFSLASADGLIYIPADANGIGAGEIVQVTLI